MHEGVFPPHVMALVFIILNDFLPLFAPFWRHILKTNNACVQICVQMKSRFTFARKGVEVSGIASLSETWSGNSFEKSWLWLMFQKQIPSMQNMLKFAQWTTHAYKIILRLVEINWIQIFKKTKSMLKCKDTEQHGKTSFVNWRIPRQIF